MTVPTHLVLAIYRERGKFRGESEEMVEKIQFDSIQFNGWPERVRGAGENTGRLQRRGNPHRWRMCTEVERI